MRGIKIALPGYDAYTDTNPDHFALYVDNSVDYILIKEKAIGSVSVTTTATVAHNLGYIPLCLVFAEVSQGVWRRLYSRDLGGWGPYYTVDASNLNFYNSGGAITFSYHIFYDRIA